MKKEYKVAPYVNSFAMYEADDFRLDNINSNEVKEGVFKRDKTVKGTFNGCEKGIFSAVDGTKYVVFNDHSAKLI